MDIILDALREQGRSQRWLARQLGIHESWFSKYRAGLRTPDEALIRRAGALLGLPESVLFPREQVLPISNDRHELVAS